MANYTKQTGILILDHPDPPDRCNIGQAAPVGLEVDIDGEPTLFLAAPGGNPNKKCYIWKITATEVDGPYLVLDKGAGNKYNCPALYFDGTYLHVIYSAAGCYQTEYHAKALPSDLSNWTVNEIPKPEDGAFHYGSVFYMPKTGQVIIISNIDDPPYNGNSWQLHRILQSTIYNKDCTSISKYFKLLDYSKRIDQRTDLPVTAMRVYAKRMLFIKTERSGKDCTWPVIVAAYRIYLACEDTQKIYYPYIGAFMFDPIGIEGEDCNYLWDIRGNRVKCIEGSNDPVDAVDGQELEILPESYETDYSNYMINSEPISSGSYARYLYIIGGYRTGYSNDYVLEVDQADKSITTYCIPWHTSEAISGHFGNAYIRKKYLYYPADEEVFVGNYKTLSATDVRLGYDTNLIGDIYRRELDGQCHKNAKLYSAMITRLAFPDKLILFNANVMIAYTNPNYFKIEPETVKEYITIKEGGIYGD